MKKYHKDYNPASMEYQGAYYLFEVSKEEKNRLITVHTIFTLLQFGLLIFAGLLNNPGSRNFFIAVPYACLFFPFAYLIMTAFSFHRVENKMEGVTYDKAFGRSLRCQMAILLFTFCTSAADIILLSQLDSKERVSESVYLLSICLLFLLCVVHRKYLLKWKKKVIICRN